MPSEGAGPKLYFTHTRTGADENVGTHTTMVDGGTRDVCLKSQQKSYQAVVQVPAWADNDGCGKRTKS